MRDLDALVRDAKRQGWTVSRTRGSHLRFCPPPSKPGPCIFGPGTPSDSRGIKNLRAHLRRAGLGR